MGVSLENLPYSGCCFFVYTLTRVNELSKREAFNAQFEMVAVDSSHKEYIDRPG